MAAAEVVLEVVVEVLVEQAEMDLVLLQQVPVVLVLPVLSQVLQSHMEVVATAAQPMPASSLVPQVPPTPAKVVEQAVQMAAVLLLAATAVRA